MSDMTPPDSDNETRPIKSEVIQSPLAGNLRTAILDLNSEAVEDLLGRAPYLVNLFLNKKQDKTVLHELVIKYTSDSTRGDSFSAKFFEILGTILRNGGEINQTDLDGNSILHLVCQKRGFPKAIHALLEAGVDGNIRNNAQQTALHTAVISGHDEDVVALVQAGVDPNVFDNRRNAPVHLAISSPRCAKVISGLALSRSSLDLRHKCTSQLGPTALHLAAKRCKWQAARALVENGASPDLVDSSGQTPLHLAVVHDVTGKISSILVNRGCNVNCKDGIQGDTPLHKAVYHEALDSLRVLVESRANVNETNSYGDSALHTAATRCADVHTWNLLLQAGGDPTRQNAQGQSPFDKALRHRNTVGVAMMRQYSPDIGLNGV